MTPMARVAPSIELNRKAGLGAAGAADAVRRDRGRMIGEGLTVAAQVCGPDEALEDQARVLAAALLPR